MRAMAISNICYKHCNTSMSRQEEECCVNAVSSSPHTKIVPMPNHGLNKEGELQGFMFMAHVDDKASVLPINNRMCDSTSIYECRMKTKHGSPFNQDILKIVNNIEKYRQALQEFVDVIRASDIQTANFDCIPDRKSDLNELESEEAVELSFAQEGDAREWSVTTPRKVGLHHAYCNTGDIAYREHKLFIVVSGSLTQACESLHNLWLDTKNDISCLDFVNSEELNWLRHTTQRNHNRIASDLAEIFDLDVDRVSDTDSVQKGRCMLVPTTSTIQSDVVYCPHSKMVKMTDDACLPENSKNGIVFEMYSSEGFWLFQGPRDNSTYNPYRAEFWFTGNESCFPTKTRKLHNMFDVNKSTDIINISSISNITTIFASDTGTAPEESTKSLEQNEDDIENENGKQTLNVSRFLRISENFMQVMQNLGFNRNDGITNLMPLVCYISDE